MPSTWISRGRCQPPARVARERMLDPERVQDADDHLAQIVLAIARRGEEVEQQVHGALGLVVVERLEPRRRRRCGSALQRDPRGQPVGRERTRDVLEQHSRAPALSPRRCSRPASFTAASGRPGWSSSARRSESSSSPRGELVGLGGDERVEELGDLRRRQRAGELVDDVPVLERLDRRDALDLEAGRDAGLASVSTLASTTLPSRAAASCSSNGRQRPTGPTPVGPEVDDDRKVARAIDDLLLEVGLGDIDHGHGSVG